MDPDLYVSISKELKILMDNPSWDDGSIAPILIRLAWHSSGTFDKHSGTGGCNGAGMRFANEANDPENAGLAVARAFLEPVKRRFPEISYSDLWILAAYVAIEHTGGPSIEFTPGRKDYEDVQDCHKIPYGRLPSANKGLREGVDAQGRSLGWESLAAHVRETFDRLGFNDKDAVALLCGGHTYGRCRRKSSGYAGPWIANPIVFSNEYAADMIEDSWNLVTNADTWLDEQGSAELRPAPGKCQYVNQRPNSIASERPPNQMMLVSDMVLLWDDDFRKNLKLYAKDEEKLKEDFGETFKKLTELGCNLSS